MEYRRLTLDDVDQAATFAVRGLRPQLYPLHLSRLKIDNTLRHLVASETDFHQFAFKDGGIVGGVAALVSEIPFFERKQATVVMLFATAPGTGWHLVRQLFAWYRSDPMLRRLLWAFEFDADPRMMPIAERFGFNSFNVVASHWKV